MDLLLRNHPLAKRWILAMVFVCWQGLPLTVTSKEVDYKLTKGGLVIKNVSPSCPMIYDNDWWGDTPDKDYLWIKASSGKINLCGNIVTRDMWNWQKAYLYKLQQGISDARKCNFDVMQKEFFDALADPDVYNPKK